MSVSCKITYNCKVAAEQFFFLSFVFSYSTRWHCNLIAFLRSQVDALISPLPSDGGFGRCRKQGVDYRKVSRYQVGFFYLSKLPKYLN